MSNGINVWYDLMTTDQKGATAFYTETIGWKTQPYEDAEPGKAYTMWAASNGPIGGVMDLPAEAQAMGMPSNWMAYTSVDDVDAAVAKAKSLGARVHKDATVIPKIGTFAILADPQGATFAVFKSDNDMPQDAKKGLGEFSWAELNTTDYEAAWKFYGELFGWKHRETMDMGPMGQYLMFNDPTGATKGGMSNAATAMNLPPSWLHYVNVDDIDAACARITSKGGKVLNGPMDVPGDDKIAQCMDPQGAMFAIYAAGKKK